jgi:hypothetical protein
MNNPICNYNAEGKFHCKNVNKNKNIEHFNTSSARGDWLQLKFTESFVLTSYKLGGQKDFVLDSPIGVRPGQNRTPKDFVLLGSTNGTEWYLLDSQSNVVFTNTDLIKTFTIQNPTLSLQFYRFVFTSHNPSVIPTIDFSRVLLYPTKNVETITSNVPLHPLNSDGTSHPIMLNAVKDDAASAAATPTLTILSTKYNAGGGYDDTTTTPISPAPTSAPTTPAPTTPAPTTPAPTTPAAGAPAPAGAPPAAPPAGAPAGTTSPAGTPTETTSPAGPSSGVPGATPEPSSGYTILWIIAALVIIGGVGVFIYKKRNTNSSA